MKVSGETVSFINLNNHSYRAILHMCTFNILIISDDSGRVLDWRFQDIYLPMLNKFTERYVVYRYI